MKLIVPKPISEIDTTHADVEEPWSLRRPQHNSHNGLPTGPNETVDDEFKRIILDDCVKDGFVVGAIVVHKKTPRVDRLRPTNWGVVIYHNPAKSLLGSVWKPVRVKWVNAGFEDVHVQSLILLIHVPDFIILQRRASADERAPNSFGFEPRDSD